MVLQFICIGTGNSITEDNYNYLVNSRTIVKVRHHSLETNLNRFDQLCYRKFQLDLLFVSQYFGINSGVQLLL